jgi:ribokinase
MGKIVVAGSLNMDLSVRVGHIPAAGETILGGDLLESPGGKGANQAYAAAKLAQGGTVAMWGCVGRDDFGREMLRNLESAGCDVTQVEKVTGPSGVALIVVSAEGENAIVVASGANFLYTPQLAEKGGPALDGADALLLQLEIPLETVKALASAARARSVRVILDPAPVPAAGLPDEILRLADVITPNETEALALTGRQDRRITPEVATELAGQLAAKGCGAIILKLGARGCLVYQQGKATFIPTPKVEAVDTTAAGDIFNGALAVGLSEGSPLTDACLFATHAAALSVTRKGAQLSAPNRHEVDAFYAETVKSPVTQPT